MKNNKKYKKKNKNRSIKLKRNSIWLTALLFFVMSLLLLGIMAVSLTSLADFAINTTLSGEFDTVAKIASDYERAGGTDKTSSITYYGKDCFITDASGNIIFQQGENTCDIKSGEQYLFNEEPHDRFSVYPDLNENIILPEDGSKIVFDFQKLFHKAEKHRHVDSPAELILSDGRPDKLDPYIDLPLWISAEMINGEKLFVKSVVKLNINDVVSVIRMLAVMLIVYLFVFIIMFINALNSILTQKRLIKLFFTDTVTGGKNKSWLYLKGEENLKGLLSAKKQYALYYIDVVKYLNFCICHSVDEGEKLLCDVYSAVKKQIRKKDICVHYDSSNFAVLVQMKDGNQMNEFAEKVLTAVSDAASGYDMSFHVGAFLVDVQTNEKGKAVRRKRSKNLREPSRVLLFTTPTSP